VDIHQLLNTMLKMGASDLHLTADSPPVLRVNGKIYPLKTGPLTSDMTQALAYNILSEKQRKTFEETQEIDLSFAWKGRSRFRANFFVQRGAVAGAIRQIPQEVPEYSQLGLPAALEQTLERPNGMILVTGPTGSGKSTTLAALVDRINQKQRGHILTIEDPIEFVHHHKNCIVNQREVGADTQSFRNALRYVLRQDPDYVLVGEIRDKESMEAALRISETGHLVMATLHTNNAIQTIHRIIDFFPPEQQEMVRTQLSFVIAAIMSQQLLPNRDGRGRSLVAELLIPNPAIRNLIREDKTHQIYSQMQMGQKHFGMQTMNQSLVQLVQIGRISKEQALSHTGEREELENLLRDAEMAPQATRKKK
jgi:twitching motility protein PilT